jgi:transposase
MRHILEVLRLKYQHQLTVREIARSSGLPPSTVGDSVQRFQAAKLSWPLPEGLGEAALQDRLLGRVPAALAPRPSRPLPDSPQIHAELRRKSVTLQLLWQEYQQTHPEGYS